MNTMLRRFVLIPVILTLGLPLAAQQSAKTVAIHAGHMLEVKTGKLLADQMLVIEDGKIVSVGPAAAATLPAGATQIDLPNATTSDPTFGYAELGISVPREALIGAKNARLTLNA